MNPKLLCRFSCAKYKNSCTHNATNMTTILNHKNSSGYCEHLDIIKYNGIDIPSPYVFQNNHGEQGIFQEVKKENKEHEVEITYPRLCYEPMFLNNSFVDPITKLHYLELCYLYRGNIITKIVGKRDVLTTNGLAGLTSHGLNIPEGKARAVADYFAKYISQSSTLTEQQIFSRFGWSNNNTSFIIGINEIMSNKITKTHLVNNIQQDTIQSFEPVGTPAGWLNGTKGLLQYDNVRFVCYAVATTLILKILGGASFVVELVGDTSKGKTIMAQVAMSMFGNPEKLKLATSATKVFIERMCATCNDLPIFLDETSMMEPTILKELTYMVANERTKGRGKKDGGVEEVDRWKSVLLTTGEVPLSNSSSLGGQDVRTVSLYGGIGDYDSENVELFKDVKELNYGVIAPLIIQKIMQEKNDLKAFYINLKSELKQHSLSDKSGVMGRTVDTYALIALSGWIFEQVMIDLGEPNKDASAIVKRVFCSKLKMSDGSLPERALHIIIDWIIENKRNFCENNDGNAEQYGIYGNIVKSYLIDDEDNFDYVDIIPSILSNTLDKKLGHPGISKRILQDWGTEDIIVLGSDGRTTIKSTIQRGSKQTRVVRLKISIIEDGATGRDF
jgi:uncharacterized protein (DUF927 family)